ncbi:MAG: hypothetical protein R3Y65_05560 [Bacillota bacterium]
MKQSKMIALSALCTAFASICVSVGNSVPMLDYAMFLAGSLFVMTPILAGSYKGGVLVAIASVFVGVMIVPNFVMVLPYVAFFAPYAVLLCFCEDEKREMNVAMKTAVKGVFFVVVELVLWKFANFFVDFEGLGLPIWALVLAGLAVLFVFDFLMKRIRRQLAYQLWRIFKLSS